MTQPDQPTGSPVAAPDILRGVSARSGIFLTGKPQQLLLFPDGVVLVQVARRVEVGESDTRGPAQGQGFAARTRRSMFVAYDDITRAEVVNASVGQHRLVLTLRDGGSRTHAYQPKKTAAAQLGAVLAGLREQLGERFVLSVEG